MFSFIMLLCKEQALSFLFSPFDIFMAMTVNFYQSELNILFFVYCKISFFYWTDSHGLGAKFHIDCMYTIFFLRSQKWYFEIIVTSDTYLNLRFFYVFLKSTNRHLISSKTTLKIYNPVFLKLRTGFWNCVLCELYTLWNHICQVPMERA